jgi:hypothetical protein
MDLEGDLILDVRLITQALENFNNRISLVLVTIPISDLTHHPITNLLTEIIIQRGETLDQISSIAILNRQLEAFASTVAIPVTLKPNAHEE